VTDEQFLEDYMDRYRRASFDPEIYHALIQLKNLVSNTMLAGKKVMIAGNGGSAAIASHVAVDFTKQGGVRTVSFNDADLITCFANDYGYENWVAKAVEFYGDKGDTVILISSSGRSMNMVSAARTAKQLNMNVVTLSGFHPNNPLKKSGDLNLWLDSKAYNIVENTHQIWLLAVCDLLVGKAEYSA